MFFDGEIMSIRRIAMQASTANLTSGYAVLADSNGLLTPSTIPPSRHLSHYFHAVWDEKTVVAGTWTQNPDSGGQTDFDKDFTTGTTAGYVNNTSSANNDELHFGDLVLNAGTYKCTVAYYKSNNCGILEILHGTTSLGTQDTYAAGDAANQVITFTYSPTARKTGNLRIKSTGKHASSSGYRLIVSRIEIIRTA